MPLIALLTDFGMKDGNVGVMKGVIQNIFHQAQIIDISHNISPQDVREAALVLLRTYRFFPAQTVFVVVVDPGVGTARRPIAAQLGDYRFVLPDNGILTPFLEQAAEENLPIQIIHLNQPAYWLTNISHVFHGRDIFAPVGAHLAAGVPMDKLGDMINDPVTIHFPKPTVTDRGLLGEVIHIDHFGNISTNILKNHLSGCTKLTVRLRGVSIPGLFHTFGDRPSGELIALLGSTDYLIVSQVNGSAASQIQAEIGDPVDVIINT
jgi:S-adenosylmethionine hydrolase